MAALHNTSLPYIDITPFEFNSTQVMGGFTATAPYGVELLYSLTFIYLLIGFVVSQMFRLKMSRKHKSAEPTVERVVRNLIYLLTLFIYFIVESWRAAWRLRALVVFSFFKYKPFNIYLCDVVTSCRAVIDNLILIWNNKDQIKSCILDRQILRYVDGLCVARGTD